MSEGWTPTSEFPADDCALTDLLFTTWVDILDLLLSAAFRREGSLPRLMSTVSQVRRASLNRHIVVVVGGRAFAEDGTVALDVGANLISRTFMNVHLLMAEAVAHGVRERNRRTDWAPCGERTSRRHTKHHKAIAVTGVPTGSMIGRLCLAISHIKPYSRPRQRRHGRCSRPRQLQCREGLTSSEAAAVSMAALISSGWRIPSEFPDSGSLGPPMPEAFPPNS